jgi:hypothetical protein
VGINHPVKGRVPALAMGLGLVFLDLEQVLEPEQDLVRAEGRALDLAQVPVPELVREQARERALGLVLEEVVNLDPVQALVLALAQELVPEQARVRVRERRLETVLVRDQVRARERRQEKDWAGESLSRNPAAGRERVWGLAPEGVMGGRCPS